MRRVIIRSIALVRHALCGNDCKSVVGKIRRRRQLYSSSMQAVWNWRITEKSENNIRSLDLAGSFLYNQRLSPTQLFTSGVI